MSNSNNGECFVIGDKAQGYANYPHMRKAGGLLFVSGISSRRPDNTHRGAEQNDDGTWTLDVKEQTQGIIENIQSILSEAGADLSHVIDVTVFLTDMTHYKGMNEIYNKFFDRDTGPTRTCVAVKELPHPNLLIEIKAQALAPVQGS